MKQDDSTMGQASPANAEDDRIAPVARFCLAVLARQYATITAEVAAICALLEIANKDPKLLPVLHEYVSMQSGFMRRWLSANSVT